MAGAAGFVRTSLAVVTLLGKSSSWSIWCEGFRDSQPLVRCSDAEAQFSRGGLCCQGCVCAVPNFPGYRSRLGTGTLDRHISPFRNSS